MNQSIVAFAISIVAIATLEASSADPLIDLKGTVVAATDGKGIGGTLVTLIAAGVSDTTDALGAFRIVKDPAAVIRFNGSDNHKKATTTGRCIDVFNVSGKLLESIRDDGNRTVNLSHRTKITTPKSLMIVRIRQNGSTSLYTGITPGGIVGNPDAASPVSLLAKTTAVADTLRITRSGFRTVKVPVSDYRMDIDTIQLQPETETFQIRKPAELSIPCSGSLSGQPTVKAMNIDMFCDCENDSLRATIYIQTRPDSCGIMSAIKYTVENGWIKTAGGGIQPLQQVMYDGGGNHFNDRVIFSWNGTFFSFYHGSFGFGWRSCTPPDCMQICKDKECRTIVFDGCKRTTCADRPSLKVRCVKVKADGTVPERLDQWTNHADFPQLPCPGDPTCK